VRCGRFPDSRSGNFPYRLGSLLLETIRPPSLGLCPPRFGSFFRCLCRFRNPGVAPCPERVTGSFFAPPPWLLAWFSMFSPVVYIPFDLSPLLRLLGRFGPREEGGALTLDLDDSLPPCEVGDASGPFQFSDDPSYPFVQPRGFFRSQPRLIEGRRFFFDGARVLLISRAFSPK